MNDIYVATSSVLNSISGTAKWYELQMNQAGNESEELSLPLYYPAVLFKLSNVAWDMNAPAVGVVGLELQVLHKEDDKPDLLQVNAGGRDAETRRLIDYDVINTVITGILLPTINPFMKLNEKAEFMNEDLIWKKTINYYCNVMSDGSPPPPTLNIDFKYLANLDLLLKLNKCCK